MTFKRVRAIPYHNLLASKQKKTHTFTKKLPNLNILMYLQNNIGPVHLLSLLIFNFLIEAKDFYLGLGSELIFLCFLVDDNTPSIIIVKGR